MKFLQFRGGNQGPSDRNMLGMDGLLVLGRSLEVPTWFTDYVPAALTVRNLHDAVFASSEGTDD